MNEYVSISGLRNISNVINKRREEIKDIFELELLPLLEECKSIYGIDSLGYNQLYSDINSKLIMLTNLLEGGITHDYEELVDNIKSMFNNDFNNKFNNLMNNKSGE